MPEKGGKMALLNSFTKYYLKVGMIQMEYMEPLVILKKYILFKMYLLCTTIFIVFTSKYIYTEN